MTLQADASEYHIQSLSSIYITPPYLRPTAEEIRIEQKRLGDKYLVTKGNCCFVIHELDEKGNIIF